MGAATEVELVDNARLKTASSRMVRTGVGGSPVDREPEAPSLRCLSPTWSSDQENALRLNTLWNSVRSAITSASVGPTAASGRGPGCGNWGRFVASPESSRMELEALPGSILNPLGECVKILGGA